MVEKFTLVAVYINAQDTAEIAYRDFGNWVTLQEAKETFAEDTGAKIENVFMLEEFNSVTEFVV